MSNHKIAIFGAGQVGSTIAYSLIIQGLVREIVLFDQDQKKAKAQVMDLQHSIPFWNYCLIKVGTIKDLKNSSIAIIASGEKQKEQQTRLDLLKNNYQMIKNIIPTIYRANNDIITIIVSNPVDILTYFAIKMMPKHKKRIFGSGTILDTARLKYLLGDYLKINPRSIHAYIVGEHGDSELPLWSTATIGNIPLANFHLNSKQLDKIFLQVKNAAYKIIAGKKATYYAIGGGVTKLVETILQDQKTIWPLSHYLHNEFGLKDVCLSLPVILGRQGIVGKLKYQISHSERKKLRASAITLQRTARQIIKL